jgi:hypothetical protein
VTTYLEKRVPISAIRLSLADIKTIYDRLALQLEEQANFEIGVVKRTEGQTDEQFEAFKKNAREKAFKITTSIIGRDGQTLFGEDSSVFNAANKPDKIGSIYLTNITAYKGFTGAKPNCAFELNLDFSKPPLIDVKNPVSAPTQNFSNLKVEGNREAWVATVDAAVMGILNGRKTKRGWIHIGGIYDLGLFLLGIPFGLYACWKLSDLIQRELGQIHAFLSGVAYVYVTFVFLYLYRALFGYTKWAFPTVELTDNNDEAQAHRAVWGVIVLSIICDVIWECLRAFRPG